MYSYDPFETGIPIELSGRKYLLYQGELLPAIYGGAEPQEEEDKPDQPQLDLQTVLNRVNQEFSKVVKPLQEQLKNFDSWRSTIEARLQPQQEEQPGEETSTDPNDTTAKRPQDGALRKQIRELTEKVSLLQSKNQEAESRAQEITIKERLTNRDRQLADSLNQLGVVSLDGGMRFFRDDPVFDEDSEEWFFSTKDGARYSIPEMVQKFTPDWLKKPVTAGGGSGNSRPGGAAIKSEIAKVREMHRKAQESGNQNLATAYWRARKELIAKGVSVSDIDQAV